MDKMKWPTFVMVVISVTIVALSILTFVPERRTEIKTAHFTFLYSTSIDSSAIVGLSEALEGSYSRISTNLNTTPAENIEVNIYAHRWRYVKATGHWSASGSIEGISKLHLLENAWLDTEISKIAIHEFVHAVVLKLLIDREPKPLNTIRFDEKFSKLPVWIWEAICTFEAEQFYDPNTLNYLSQGKYPEISELNDRSKGQKIYTCGYTIIEYILNTHGRDKLIELIENYGDLKGVLNLTEEQFSKNWYIFIKRKYNLPD